MAESIVTFDVYAVVKGYHVYRCKVPVGEECICVLEPKNQFDEDAVAVCLASEVIGHVPATPIHLNRAFSAIMKKGLPISW